MLRLLIPLALVAFVFWVFSVVDCAAQPAIRHRAVPKTVWILIVIFIPVLGGLLWFGLGRVRAAQLNVPDSPDDDPAFLGGIETRSAQDERIRRLEEELAKLDAEDAEPKPDPKKPRRGDKPAADDSTPHPSPRGDGDAEGRHGAIG